MIKGNQDHIIFFTENSDEAIRTPIQALICDIVDAVDARIRLGYVHDIETIADVPVPEMLIMVTANIFANLSHQIMNSLDTKLRLQLFDELQGAFNKISKDLFLALQTYFSEEKIKN